MRHAIAVLALLASPSAAQDGPGRYDPRRFQSDPADLPKDFHPLADMPAFLDLPAVDALKVAADARWHLEEQPAGSAVPNTRSFIRYGGRHRLVLSFSRGRVSTVALACGRPYPRQWAGVHPVAYVGFNPARFSKLDDNLDTTSWRCEDVHVVAALENGVWAQFSAKLEPRRPHHPASPSHK